jgi:hypothetical protein
MTLNEWRDNPSYADELRAILRQPVLQAALTVLDGLTAAKTIGNAQTLFSTANNAHVLFGFDAGRASVIKDLTDLTLVPEEISEQQPSYTKEF